MFNVNNFAFKCSCYVCCDSLAKCFILGHLLVYYNPFISHERRTKMKITQPWCFHVTSSPPCWWTITKDLSSQDNAPIKSKLQHPPPYPRANYGHLTILCARGVWSWPLPAWGGGSWTEVSGFKWFFFSGAEVANIYKTRVWTRWKTLKKRCSICERLAHKGLY